MRAYAKKFPGYLFSDFKAILLSPKAMISVPQYKQIMEDYFETDSDAEDNYNDMIKDY